MHFQFSLSLRFLQDINCDVYKRYRRSVESMRKGMDAERIKNKEEMAKSGKSSFNFWKRFNTFTFS